MAKSTTIWNKTFTVVFIVNILTALSFHILTPTLPKYVLALGFSADIAGVVATMFTVTAVTIRMFSGRYLDKRKKKNIMILSLIIIAAAILGYSQSTSVGALIFFRLLHGVGWGLTTTANSTIAAEALPEDKLGRGIGLFGIASSLASAIAPNLGLQLIESVGYLVMFLIAFCLAALGCVISTLIVESKMPQASEPPDMAVKENKVAHIAFSFFAKEAIFPATLMIFVNICYNSITTFLAVYAGEKNISGVGYYFTVAAILMLFTRPLFGRLNDHSKKSTIIYPCAFAFAMVFVVIFFSDSLLWLLGAAALFGIGYGGLQPTFQVWCVKAAGEGNRGKANSTFYTAVDIGQGIGSTVAGVLAVNLGYRYMYLSMIIPIVIMVALFTGYRLLKRRAYA